MGRFRLSTYLFIGAGALFGHLMFITLVGAQPAPEPRGGADAATSLECGGDDELVYHQVIDMRAPNRPPGGPDGGREALGAYLRGFHPYLEGAGFNEAASNGQAAQFVVRQNGKRVATAFAAQVPAVVSGNSEPGPDVRGRPAFVNDWFVESFSACARFLNEREGGF